MTTMFSFTQGLKHTLRLCTTNHINSIRHYAVRKRFYKNTGILHSGGKFEVTLDQRKLKTPKGNLLLIDNKPLALAVAAEWDAQKDKINQAGMHLTTLCNTVIDNPNNFTKIDIVEYLVDYLNTDTILFQSGEDDDLYKFQVKEWDPIIDWFCKRYNVDIKKCRDMEAGGVTEDAKNVIRRQLMSYNFAALNGFVYGVDTLKSVLLTFAAVERFLTPEKAVLLSRLEEEYQLGYWGRVEWAHDLNQQDLQSRLSAVVLFFYFNTTFMNVQNKDANFAY